MAKLRCKPHDPTVVENRQKGDDVVEVADGTLHLVGIVGNKHIALLDCTVPNIEELCDETAELTNQHFALAVGYDIEFILLLSDGRGHAAS